MNKTIWNKRKIDFHQIHFYQSLFIVYIFCNSQDICCVVMYHTPYHTTLDIQVCTLLLVLYCTVKNWKMVSKCQKIYAKMMKNWNKIVHSLFAYSSANILIGHKSVGRPNHIWHTTNILLIGNSVKYFPVRYLLFCTLDTG